MSQNYVVEELCSHTLDRCVKNLTSKRYKSNSPSGAAKKVANKAAVDYGYGIYYVTVRETTQGSNKNRSRYKIRVLKATKDMISKAEENNLHFIPQRYARIEQKYVLN